VTSYGFKRGSKPAILFSLGRLLFRATVAATRLTSRFQMQSVVFWLGFWIGYTMSTGEKSRP
jgi:hypothetical protein